MAPVKDSVRIAFRRRDDGVKVTGNRVRIGERYLLEVSSEAAGRLILVDVDAAGKVTQIFPNKFVEAADASVVRAGDTVTMPGPGYGFDWLKAVDPVGAGRLLAFVVPEDFPVERTVASEERLARGFQPERAPTNYLMSLTTQVYKTLREDVDGRADPERWALRIADYEILD